MWKHPSESCPVSTTMTPSAGKAHPAGRAMPELFPVPLCFPDFQAAEGTHKLTWWCSASLGHLCQVRVK